MNCDDFTKSVDDYLDETCEESVRTACFQHLAECSACSTRLQHEHELLRLLEKLPVPDPSAGFFDRALDQSMGGNIQSGIDRGGATSFGNWKAAAGGALAAGLVTIALLGIFFAPNDGSPTADIPQLTLSLHMPDTVRLSFNSSVALPNARLILEIPPGIDVVGADGQRRITWKTDIQRGANILKLPVIVHNADGGILTATVIHESREKTFLVRISAI